MANHPPIADPASFGRMSLAEAAELLAAQKLPPVETWAPTADSDSRMEIRADGSWWHDGGQITRPALVRLFSSILRREDDGRFALVTPHERQFVQVADTPFRAVELLSEGAGNQRRLLFRLDGGAVVLAGPDHPLRVDGTADAPRPLLHVRGRIGLGLEARLSRSLFVELAELALAEPPGPGNIPGIWSSGGWFALVPPEPPQ